MSCVLLSEGQNLIRLIREAVKSGINEYHVKGISV